MGNKIVKKEINQFFREVKQQLKLSYNSTQMKKIFLFIQNSTESYFQENPSATFSDFQNEFGTTKDIIASALEIMDTDTLSKKLNNSAFIKRCCMIVLMLALLAFGIKTGLYIKSYHDV